MLTIERFVFVAGLFLNFGFFGLARFVIDNLVSLLLGLFLFAFAFILSFAIAGLLLRCVVVVLIVHDVFFLTIPGR